MRPGAAGTSAGQDDYVYREQGGRRVMFRVNYLHDKDYPASLELLGAPQILAVAESLCGVNFVPTYEAMVFKQEGAGVAIRWHQDAVHPRRWRIFNLDVYLDASRKGAGALLVIPGTQVAKQAFCGWACFQWLCEIFPALFLERMHSSGKSTRPSGHLIRRPTRSN